MDRSEKKNGKRQSGKKLPRVPIKTYKWEDVRRARRKGGYPWTYLYKASFKETVDAKNFRMDGLRKNKTSSGSSVSDSLEIREITEDDIKGLEGIDSSYVVIESPILLGVHMDEPMKDQDGILESADSSDNISQYLDKEERGPEQQLESTETLTLPGPSTPEVSNGRQTERAKSEEPKRKRKLSVESNYSRISLSRLGVMKRLKDAKEKIKLPKFGSKSKKEPETKTKTNPKQLEEPRREQKIKSAKTETPVYIHIPLKPPEGKEDEFSHLEFEEKRPQAPQPIPEVQIEVTEEEKEEADKVDIQEIDEKNSEVLESNENDSGTNNLGLLPPNDEEDDVSAIIFLEGEEGSENKEEYDIIAVDIDENSQEMKMSQITNTELRRQVLESIKKVDSQPNISGSKEGSGANLSRSSSKASKVSKASIRKRRAKSVEPEKKRRGSIDSSYSRKSLSKVGILKKLKQFHMPFVKSQSKKSVTDTASTMIQTEPPKATPKHQVPSKDEKPVYIHIPLKPAEGQQDEFSHLEFETAPPPRPSNETNDTIETKEDEIESPIDTPQIAKSPQFIVLTPPSDDELLDRPDIPDTPSSETGSLFQFGELKQLAKKAVDQILESVDEETDQKSEKNIVVTEAVVEVQSAEEQEDTQQEGEEKESHDGGKVTIDEEDGLKSMPAAIDDVKSNLKSNLKGENSPLPKKKVSFKRRKSSQVSQVSKDDGYEEIESPSAASVKGGKSAGVSKADDYGTVVVDSASASDEAEPDLDSERLEKSTPLEEQSNRWSKISDHEYEPVNPPPEEKNPINPPKSHVSEVLNPSSAQTHQYSDDELDLSVQEMQSEMENRFFGGNRNANVAFTRTAETRTSPSRRSPSKRSSRSRSKEKEPAKPGRLQTAIKDGATKFKTKLQGIKKPNISLPSRPKFQKPNFKKPNINLPKLPDLSSTFKRTSKQEVGKNTQTKVTEAKATEAKTMENSGGKGIFDFSTYPRIFKKKKRDHDSASLKGDEMEKVEKKKWKVKSSEAPDVIRIPLHSEASLDKDNGIYPQPEEILEVGQIDTEGASSPSAYQEDIETDDEDFLQRERQEKHRAVTAATYEVDDSRWDHGNFYRSHNGTKEQNQNLEDTHQEEEEEEHQEEVDHEKEEEEIQSEEEKEEDYIPKSYEKQQTQQEMVTDLDLPEETQPPFVPMRQKGRLQQNDSFDTNHSKVGSSVSSLGQHRRGVLEEIDSDQFFLREKGISQDNIDMGKYLSTEIREAFRSPTNALADIHSYNYEELRASNQSLPETKRKPVKKPKRRKTPHGSQERLRYEPESENEEYNFMPPIRPKRKSKRRKRPEPEVIPFVETIQVDPPESAGYFDEQEDDLARHYENDQMEGIEQPHIQISEPYAQQRLLAVDHHDAHRRASEPLPAAPPRKHKSLKSLNASEHESIFEEYERNNENMAMNGYANEEVFMSSDMDQTQPPHHSQMQQEPPIRPKPPTRSRSKTRSMSRTTSQADRDSILGRMDSIMFDEELREPVVEEPCIKDLRDAMGYAIVDKNQNKNWEHRCCTVPRSKAQPPERPLRNYSTLGPSRPSRKLSKNMTDEEKENIEVDISQYIEIEDERDLHSGEVIQKIQNRPLPAPPRPPRSRSKPLNEITSRSNMEIDAAEQMSEKEHHIDETEVSTQTEPLPSDFVCEEMVQEETDKIMTPSALRKNDPQKVPDKEPEVEDVMVRRILIAPTQYSYQEETITHGQLLVEPLNGARILPDSDLSRERIIPVTSDEEEISEIPENFTKLSDPKIGPEAEHSTEDILETPEHVHQLPNPEEQLPSEPTDTKLSCEAANDRQFNSESLNVKPENSSRQLPAETQDAKPARLDEEEPKRPPRTSSTRTESIEVLKTHKLQVSDLDVDRLTVNELVANKIVVSEIDSGNITSHEISSKSGVLKLADLELQPEVVRKLLEQLQQSSKQQQSLQGEDKPRVTSEDTQGEEKKTSTDFRFLESSMSQDSTVTLVPLAEKDCSLSPSQNLITSGIPVQNEELTSKNIEEPDSCDDICEENSQEHVEDYELGSDNNSPDHTHLSEVDTELKNCEDIVSDIEYNSYKEQNTILEVESPLSSSAEENYIINEDKIEKTYQQIPVSTEEIMSLVEANFPNIDTMDVLQTQTKDEEPPVRPPRTIEKKQSICGPKPTEEQQTHLESLNVEPAEVEDIPNATPDYPSSLELLEPDVDDEPPPRPPQPQVPYVPSQPPASFYALRAQHYVEDLPDDIPLVPRRKRQHRPNTTISKSSSSESSSAPVPRRRVRSPEPSIPQLTGQLVGACSNVARNRLKRLIDEINSRISSDPDAETTKQNVQVIMVILLVLIIVLLLLGDGRTVHLHHWEYFNPPTDI